MRVSLANGSKLFTVICLAVFSMVMYFAWWQVCRQTWLTVQYFLFVVYFAWWQVCTMQSNRIDLTGGVGCIFKFNCGRLKFERCVVKAVLNRNQGDRYGFNFNERIQPACNAQCVQINKTTQVHHTAHYSALASFLSWKLYRSANTGLKLQPPTHCLFFTRFT